MQKEWQNIWLSGLENNRQDVAIVSTSPCLTGKDPDREMIILTIFPHDARGTRFKYITAIVLWLLVL